MKLISCPRMCSGTSPLLHWVKWHHLLSRPLLLWDNGQQVPLLAAAPRGNSRASPKARKAGSSVVPGLRLPISWLAIPAPDHHWILSGSWGNPKWGKHSQRHNGNFYSIQDWIPEAPEVPAQGSWRKWAIPDWPLSRYKLNWCLPQKSGTNWNHL